MAKRMLLTALLIAAHGTAHAQLIEVTPEIFTKMRAIAEQARAKHPTSPAEAANYFSYTFNGEFGDVLPTAEASIVRTSDLDVTLTTPINLDRARFITALQAYEPLPDALGPVRLIGITVTPRTMNAPNITKALVFRGEQIVEPLSSTLQPREFTNRMGAKTMIAAGVLLFPVEAFAPGAVVRVVLLTNGPQLEREFSLDALARLK